MIGPRDPAPSDVQLYSSTITTPAEGLPPAVAAPLLPLTPPDPPPPLPAPAFPALTPLAEPPPVPSGELPPRAEPVWPTVVDVGTVSVPAPGTLAIWVPPENVHAAAEAV